MFTFAHISDLHIPPMPSVRPRALANKRVLGYLSWHRKRKAQHRAEVLDALRADLMAQAPDHICVTGDLTNISLPAEFRAAAEWLRTLGEPARLSVILGNHDAYVHTDPADTQGHLAAWTRGDDGAAGWPAVRRRDGIAFIGVNTAVPMPAFVAAGRVGPDQLARLHEILKREGHAGQFRVVLIHHPPQTGIVSARKALRDAAAVRDVLRDAGAELVLHGHAHFPVRSQLPGPDGAIPVLGAASASLMGGERRLPGQYYLFRMETTGNRRRLRLQSRTYDHVHRHFSVGMPWTTVGDSQAGTQS